MSAPGDLDARLAALWDAFDVLPEAAFRARLEELLAGLPDGELLDGPG